MVQWLETLNVSGWEQSISRKCKRDVTVICVVTSLFILSIVLLRDYIFKLLFIFVQ